MADPLPLRGFPSGRIRIRQRPAKAVKAYVKGANEIAAFVIKEDAGCWVPVCKIAVNIHTPRLAR